MRLYFNSLIIFKFMLMIKNNKQFNRIDLHLIYCSRIKLILISTFIAIFLSISFAILIDLISGEDFYIKDYSQFDKKSLKYFFIAVFIAPIFETIIFQILPYLFLSNYIQNKKKIVIISALFFGCMHYFNSESIFEILIVTLIGIVYSYTYFISIQRKENSPFLNVSLVHSNYNLFVFIVYYLSS